MEKTLNCDEGPSAATAFDAEVRFLLSVPHSVMIQREAEYKEASRSKSQSTRSKTEDF